MTQIKKKNIVVSFDLIAIHPQFIHGWMHSSPFEEFYITMIYVDNYHGNRKALWVFLPDTTRNINKPWIVLSDFNCCRFEDEKAEDNSIPNNKLIDFNHMIFIDGLRNLSFSSLYFSRSNSRINQHIHLKLD